MNELQLLQETRKSDTPVPTASLDRGLAQLMSTIENDTRRPTTNKRWSQPRRSLIALAAAAALIVGPMAVGILLPNSPQGATAQAAEILDEAALATIETADPIVGASQYLMIDINAVYASSIGHGGAQHTWLATQDSQLYIPADRSEEWVWIREPEVPVTFFSDDAREAAQEISRTTEPFGQTVRAPGGAFYGSPQQFLGNPLAEAIQDSPRDQQELLDLIYATTEGEGWSPEQQALTAIADFLRTGAVPADLRSALYKAAALIDGVEVIDESATIDGRSGTAIGIETPDQAWRQDIIIDVETGLMIGERVTALKTTPQYPSDTVISWTTSETSVVDSAP